MADAAIIDTGGGGGGGGAFSFIADHPIIAAAAVGGVIGLVMLVRRGAAAPADSGTASVNAPSGGQLSPSANIALGQVAYDVTQGFGQASIASAQNQADNLSHFDRITNALNGLSGQVEAGATANATALNNLGVGMSLSQRQEWADFLNLMALGGHPLNGDVTGPFYYLDGTPGAENSLAAHPTMPALSSAAA